MVHLAVKWNILIQGYIHGFRNSSEFRGFRSVGRIYSEHVKILCSAGRSGIGCQVVRNNFSFPSPVTLGYDYFKTAPFSGHPGFPDGNAGYSKDF
jgi:hypothetical protein